MDAAFQVIDIRHANVANFDPAPSGPGQWNSVDEVDLSVLPESRRLPMRIVINPHLPSEAHEIDLTAHHDHVRKKAWYRTPLATPIADPDAYLKALSASSQQISNGVRRMEVNQPSVFGLPGSRSSTLPQSERPLLNPIPSPAARAPDVTVYYDIPGLAAVPAMYSAVLPTSDNRNLVLVLDLRAAGSNRIVPSDPSNPVAMSLAGTDRILMVVPTGINFVSNEVEYTVLSILATYSLDQYEVAKRSGSLPSAHGFVPTAHVPQPPPQPVSPFAQTNGRTGVVAGQQHSHPTMGHNPRTGPQTPLPRQDLFQAEAPPLPSVPPPSMPGLSDQSDNPYAALLEGMQLDIN